MKPLILLVLSLSLPCLAGPLCDVKTFGARGDGKTKDTRAIQAAIDACAERDGTVRLHDGVYLTGMLRLKSRLTFSIEPSATLRGTQDDADYPATHPPTDNSQLSNCRKALLYAEHAHDLTLEGGGTIDGNGNVAKWLGPSRVHPERTRPMAIYLTLSDRVRIENLKIRDSAMWTLVNLETDHLIIRNIDIHSNLSGNRDGIDLVDCHHVLVEDVRVFSEDDSICLKSGTARGVEDVIVRNSQVLQSSVANGLKLGTASSGAFRNIHFENIDLQNVDKAAMAVESVDGAEIAGVSFEKIRFRRAGTAFFVILGKRGNPPRIGSIDDVRFENIVGDQMKHRWGSALSGSLIGGKTYAPSRLTFRNVQVTYQGGAAAIPSDPPEYDGRYPDPNLWGDLPAAGLYLRHVRDTRLEDAHFDVVPRDARKVLLRRDSE